MTILLRLLTADDGDDDDYDAVFAVQSLLRRYYSLTTTYVYLSFYQLTYGRVMPTGVDNAISQWFTSTWV